MKLFYYFFVQENIFKEVRASLFPYVGYGQEKIFGNIRFDVNGSMPAKRASIDSDKNYWISGLNVNLNFHRIINLKIKHMASYKKEKTYNSYSAIFNVFINKNRGISYIFKDMQNSSGKNIYNLASIVFVF